MFISNAWRAFLELKFYDCMVKIIPHIYQKNCSYLSYLPRYISKIIVLTGLIFESLQNTLLHPVVCIQAIKIWLQNYHGRFKPIIANNYYHCLCNGYFQLIFPTAPPTPGNSLKPAVDHQNISISSNQSLTCFYGRQDITSRGRAHRNLCNSCRL